MWNDYLDEKDMNDSDRAFRTEGPQPLTPDRFHRVTRDSRDTVIGDGACRTCAKQGVRPAVNCDLKPRPQLTVGELRRALASQPADAPVWLLVTHSSVAYEGDGWDFMYIPCVEIVDETTAPPGWEGLIGSVAVHGGDGHDSDAAWERIEPSP